MFPPIGRSALVVLTLLVLGVSAAPAQPDPSACTPLNGPVLEGETMRWHPIGITFEGPYTAEDATPNPFLDYRLTVTFTHAESGLQVAVPGFYAADRATGWRGTSATTTRPTTSTPTTGARATPSGTSTAARSPSCGPSPSGR